MSRALIFISLIFFGCSSITSQARLGECYRNRWHDGLWRVSQLGEDQVTLVEVPSTPEQLERIKVVGRWYGGWNLEVCPQNVKNWKNTKN